MVAQAFGNRGFVVCLVLMVALSIGYQATIMAQGTKLRKLPVYLRKPLSQLDGTKLSPYQLIPGGAAEIKPEILDALGTRHYIQWTLEDTSLTDRRNPERIINFFVTYYTDTPGQVPHVPEECYLGGGYQKASEQIVEVEVPALHQTVPFKVLTFERPAFVGRDSQTVMYTFHANGRFAPDRQAVRAILNNPKDSHSYFSKLEISFGSADAVPSTERALAAGRRFLAKAVPVLVNEHWPDWSAVEKAESKGEAVEQTESEGDTATSGS